MINKKILGLTPKKIFCPVCGSWHNWNGKPLKTYDSDNKYIHQCDADDDFQIELYFDDDGDIHLESSMFCDAVGGFMSDIIVLDEDVEIDDTQSILKFTTTIQTDEGISSTFCDGCDGCKLPLIADKIAEREGDDGDDDEGCVLDLEFQLEFAGRYFEKYAQEYRTEKRKELEQEEKAREKELTKAQKSKEVARKRATSANGNNISNCGGNQLSKILPLLLLKDKLGIEDDMIKLLIVSSMMSGNNVGSTNPLMWYLLLKIL